MSGGNTDILRHVKDSRLRVRAKPNSDSTEVEGYDESRDFLVIKVAAPPEKGKANKELLRFLSRETGKKAFLKSGAASRDKVVVLEPQNI